MRVSWANQWRQRHAQGDVIIARYADDIVVGFEHETEARLADMRGRLAKFALMLHGEKTRLSALTACRRIGSLRDPIEFGRFAAKRRRVAKASRGTFSASRTYAGAAAAVAFN
jgi:RNA-directed DNA polymerase